MKKKSESQEKLEYVSTKDFDEITGVYKEFINNNYGVSIVLDTESGIKALGLQTVARGLLKANLDKLVSGETEVTIIKMPKPASKSYFLYELYLDGVKMESQTRFNAIDVKEFL